MTIFLLLFARSVILCATGREDGGLLFFLPLRENRADSSFSLYEAAFPIKQKVEVIVLFPLI